MLFLAVALATAATVSAEAKHQSLRTRTDTVKATGAVSTLADGDTADGFAYVNFYAAAGCAGPIVASTGKPTNKCIISYNDFSSDAPTGSTKVTCNNGKPQVGTLRHVLHILLIVLAGPSDVFRHLLRRRSYSVASI